MKYFFNGTAPEYERRTANINVIENIDDLDSQYIFQNYTGLGGLHGLKFNDYANYHDYTEAKKILELGQFFTPPALCQAIIESLNIAPTDKIGDFTCGSGNFFNFHTEQNCYGCELETDAYKVAKKLYPKAVLMQGDFSTATFPAALDVVVGNPPFNLKTKQGKVSQYAYIQKAAQYLKPGKLLAVIVPKTFLADEYSNRSKWEEIQADFDFICQAEIPTGYFDVDLDIKIMYLRKAGVNRSFQIYTNDYVEFDPAKILADYIIPIQEDNKRNAAALHLYSVRAATDGDRYTADLIKKYLYHIKARKPLRQKYYEKAMLKIQLLKTQERPEKMKTDEWEAIKITPEKIISWMKRKVSSLDRPQPKKIIKLVKSGHYIKHKAYCKTLAKDQRAEAINDMVLKGKRLTNNYDRLLQKKIQQYKNQETPFTDMKRTKEIDSFLTDFRLSDRESQTGLLTLFGSTDDIQLNDKQFQDLGLAFQKDYFILNWQQGGGKSVAGMAWINFIRNRVKNTFIVAPSLAVQLTWKPRLLKYGYDFIIVDKFHQFEKIKKGQIVVLSFDMVRILQRHLKRFIKQQSYKIALLVDESDELTNIASSRTRAMLNCFRKKKYAILTTGTTTRNTINEIYPQLELLYNNSINLLCWSDHIYKPDKDKVLQRHRNDAHYGKPFPPFRGHRLFQHSFCPERTTVFGVKADTQDIYNADVLKKILDKSVITRTFDDIVGKRIYTIKNHRVLQNKDEKKLYQTIIEEFYTIVHAYFTNTGNSRKEALLRLIRQITLLIQSTSIPHTFEHYPDSKELPQKFYKIRDMVKKWSDEKVAIGTVMVEAAKEYEKFLSKQFPARQVFYVDGTKSFAARKKIIANFQATSNGILISTQQSLKSSVDIETCDKCILESLQWNLPKMSQYYFRFIRYNSKKKKEIHFVTYAGSIEQNILALLMSKEKLNEFVKTGQEVSREDMFAEFGIDKEILNQIIEKSYDDKGQVQLRWGTQHISAA